MNSKELVKRTLRGLPAPRVPSGPLAVHYCAHIAGHSLRQYSTKARALADSILRYYELFRPDAVWLSCDTWITAEAMGARVGAADENQPLGGVGAPSVEKVADIDRIPRPNPGTQGRQPIMLEALSRVVQAIGSDAFVVGCFDQYPFSLAAALMGINEIMLRVVDDPPFVRALMARCAEYNIAYGRALAEAGAEMLSGGDSPVILLGPDLYESLTLPLERSVIAALKSTGRPVSLHICGNTTGMLRQMVSSGADVLEVDHFVRLSEVFTISGRETTIWGNLDPVALLARGSPSEVEQAAGSAIAEAQRARHRRFVLSSGCTLAIETPAVNIHALNRVARNSHWNEVCPAAGAQ